MATHDQPQAGDARPQATDVVPVVSEHWDELVQHVCLKTGIDPHAAEDAVQTVVERVLRGRLTPDRASWLTYLRRAVVNEGHNARDAMQSGAAREAHDFDQRRARSGDVFGARLDWLDLIRDLATLSEEERRVLVMRHFEDMRYSEIAAATGLNVVAVDNRLRQARAKMKVLREQREQDRSLALLALVAGSGARRVPGFFAASGAAAVAATALVVLAAVTTPAPAASALQTAAPVPPLASAVAYAVGASPRAGAAARPGPYDLTPTAATTASRRGPTGPGAASPNGNVDLTIQGCARDDLACVSNRPRRGQTWTGDRYTVPRLRRDSPEAIQRAIPLCWLVSAQPAVRCQEGNHGYTVKEVPPRSAPAEPDLGGQPA